MRKKLFYFYGKCVKTVFSGRGFRDRVMTEVKLK